MPYYSGNDATEEDVVELQTQFVTVQHLYDTMLSGMSTGGADRAALHAQLDALQDAVNADRAANVVTDSAEQLARVNAVAAEIAARAAADTLLSDAIAAEVTARISAIAGEASARNSADSALSDQVAALTASIGAAAGASGTYFFIDTGQTVNIGVGRSMDCTNTGLIVDGLLTVDGMLAA